MKKKFLVLVREYKKKLIEGLEISLAQVEGQLCGTNQRSEFWVLEECGFGFCK